jgi:hypothetical protein
VLQPGQQPGHKLDSFEPSAARVTRTIDRVHYDEPGDGRVWVMGGNYKASFGPEGATYVPYFGSSAPRNFPLHFALESAHIGGTPLELSGPRVVREEGAVALDRGTLVERWHVALMHAEQTFVLRSLPAPGDLVLTLRVESELTGVDVADGLVFEGEFGRVGYGDVTVLDAAGRSLQVPSQLEGGHIRLQVPGSFLAEATLPVTVDPVVANFFLDPSREAYTADMAYDATTGNWFVSMQEVFSATDADVRGEILDSTGTHVPSQFAYIDYTTQTWTAPMCANNNAADQFLVVAVRGASGSRAIWGRTRAAGSVSMAPQFEISAGSSGEKVNPDVGGDPSPNGPSHYCVVWQRIFSSTDEDIHYRLVAPDSSLVGSSTGMIDNSSATIDFNPEVSKSNGGGSATTQRWNVVFSRVWSATDTDVRGAQVAWDGLLVTPSFSVDYSGEDHDYPQPSSPLDSPHGERDWACVYRAITGASSDIRISALRKDIRYVATNLTQLEAGVIGNTWLGQAQDGPHITSDGTQYLVTYHELFSSSTTDWDVYCTTLRHEGAGLEIVEAHRNLAFSSAAEAWPRLASRADSGGTPGRFGVAWHQSGGSTGERDVEGVLFDVDDTWAATGTVVCPGAANSSGEPASFRALGTSTRAANRLRFDVHGLPLNSSGFFLMGRQAGNVAVGQGTLCIGAPVQRLSTMVQFSGGFGAIVMPLDLNTVPVVVSAGVTWRFQYWYRDGVGGTLTSNLSNAIAIAFQ